MLKRILSVITGIATGVLIVTIGDAIAHKMHPPPYDLDLKNIETIRAFALTIPTKVLILMFAFWIISSFAGGFVAGKINKAGWKVSSVVTGSVLMIVALINLFMLPHPLWMLIGALILYIPAAFAGGKLAS